MNYEPYTLDELARSLNNAKRYDRLHKLLTNKKWMEAKFEHHRSDVPYMRDVQRALNQIADPLSSTDLIALLRLWASQQAVHHRTRNYTDTDLETLVYLGDKTMAVNYAEVREDHKQLFGSLWKIYKADQAYSKGSDLYLLNRLLDVADQVEDADLQHEFWAKLAEEFYDLKRYEDHRSVLQRMDPYSHWYLTGLVSLASLEDNLASLERISQNIASIDNSINKLELQSAIAEIYYERGEATRAYEDWQAIYKSSLTLSDEDDRLSVLCILGGTYASHHFIDEATQIFDKAKEFASHIFAESMRNYWLMVVAVSAGKAGFLEQALTIAQEMSFSQFQASALSLVAVNNYGSTFANEERILEVLAEIEALAEANEDQASYWRDLAVAYGDIGKWDLAENFLARLKHDEFQHGTYSQIALSAAKQNLVEKARHFLNLAIQLPVTPSAYTSRVSALNTLLEFVTNQPAIVNELMGQTLSLIQQIEDLPRQREALQQTIQVWMQLGYENMCWQLLNVFSDKREEIACLLAETTSVYRDSSLFESLLDRKNLSTYSIEVLFHFIKALILEQNYVQAEKELSHFQQSTSRLLDVMERTLRKKEVTFDTLEISLRFTKWEAELHRLLALAYSKNRRDKQYKAHLHHLEKSYQNASIGLVQLCFAIELAKLHWENYSIETSAEYLIIAHKVANAERSHDHRSQGLQLLINGYLYMREIEKATNLLGEIASGTTLQEEATLAVVEHLLAIDQLDQAKFISQRYSTDRKTRQAIGNYLLKTQNHCKDALTIIDPTLGDELFEICIGILKNFSLSKEEQWHILSKVAVGLGWADPYWYELITSIDSVNTHGEKVK
jgi:tetratricopeptide (TPR) repeat protein